VYQVKQIDEDTLTEIIQSVVLTAFHSSPLSVLPTVALLGLCPLHAPDTVIRFKDDVGSKLVLRYLDHLCSGEHFDNQNLAREQVGRE
jgi:hypothetical protein